MRKKCVTIAVVLLLLIGVCLAEQIMVYRYTQDALSETREVLSLIQTGDLSAAQKKAHALDRTWDEDAKKLEVLVDHRSTDDVRYALSKLLAALESGDNASSLIYAGELEGGIEHVYERQAVTLENMF